MVSLAVRSRESKKLPAKRRKELESFLERGCKREKTGFFERGVYSDDHPITRYVHSLSVLKSNKKAKVYVTKGWDEINACSLPDGTVFISDRLIDFCKYQEELEFVVQHEITHIERKHVRKQFEEGNIVEGIGRARFSEYEADLRAMLENNNAPVNPYGGITFLERLTKHESTEEKSGFDPVHGETATRLINMEHAVRLVDMDALTSDLVRIPASIKRKLLTEEDLWKVFKVESNGPYSFHFESGFEELLHATKKLGLSGVLSNISKVYTDTKLEESQKDQLLNIMLGKIDDVIKPYYPNISEEMRAALVSFVVSGATISADIKPIRRVAQNKESFTEFIKLASQLPEELPLRFHAFNALGRKLFVMLTTVLSLNGSPKDAYEQAFDFLKRLKETYLKFEGYSGRWGNEETTLALLLIRTYNKNKKGITDCIESLGRNCSSAYRHAVWTALRDHFELGAEEETALKNHKYFKEGKDVLFKDRVIASERLQRIVEVYNFVNKKHMKEIFENETRVGKELGAVFEIIQPKNLDDFIEFVDDYYRYLMKEKVDRKVSEDRFIMLLVRKQDRVYSTLKAVLKIQVLGNRDALKLAKCMDTLGVFSVDPNAIHMYFIFRNFTRKDFAEFTKLFGKREAQHIAFAMLSKIKKREDVFDFLKFVYNDILEGEIIDIQERFCVSSNKLALNILRKYEFDMRSSKEFDELLTVSCFIEDPNLKLRLQKAILKRYTPLLSGRKAYELLFEDKRVAEYANIEERERYLDKRIKKAGALKTIKKKIITRTEKYAPKKLGEVVAYEYLMYVLLNNKERLSKALLSTSKSNSELMTYLAETAVVIALKEKWKGEDFAAALDKYQMDADVTRSDVLDFIKFEELLYKTDYESKHLLCRELLIGKEGILLDKKARKNTLKWFFEEYVERPKNENEKLVYDFLKTAFDAVVKKADPSTLYFIIHPLMVERILGKPRKRISWKAALSKAKKNVKNELKKYQRHPHDEYYMNEELEGMIYLLSDGMIATQNMTPADDLTPIKERNVAEEHLELNKICMDYVEDSPQIVEAIPVVEFVKDLASKLGAPGVRFLQSLGIYAELPPGVREEFDDVYDNVKGQLKLSGFHTVQKGWNGNKKLKELESFGQRIGGGSLVTVYESKVNGKKCVLKVVNPNVAYRTEKMCDNIKGMFSTDKKLKKAIPLVENIRSWIKTDVSFSDEEYAGLFSEQNDGFKVNGNEYVISIPPITKRGKRFVVEDFAEGENLTKWNKLKKKHDMKKVISLVVKNAVHQLSNGLCHADIHVGNIRVSKDKKVSLIDKNLLLALNDYDKEFIGSLVYLVNDKHALATAIADYICSFEENRKVKKEVLGKKLQEAFTEQKDIASFVTSAVTMIHEKKGKIPLNVMLLVKNALALERMAKRAGFDNIIEAYLYQP